LNRYASQRHGPERGSMTRSMDGSWKWTVFDGWTEQVLLQVLQAIFNPTFGA